jgi:hypothetical protein
MKYLLLLTLIFAPLASFAQINSPLSAFSERVIITLSPEYPAPNETVTARVASSFYDDLKRAEIVWQIDGAEKKRAIGETTFQFQAPANGREMELFATINNGDIESYAGFRKIRTANLDLIYEANTYTPPFYKGRSLYVPQSEITIAALATIIEGGVQLPKDKIIYSWYKDSNLITDLSGVGKDSIKIQGDVLSRPFYVSVIAESLNSNAVAKKRILINPTQPKVVLYENNPIFGSIFEKALTGEFNFDREEVGITAIPYFFSTEDRSSGSLKYSWFENGKSVGGEGLGSFINYLNPNKEKNGVSNLGVKIEHSNNFRQSGNNSFKINVLGNQQSDTIEINESSAF